MVSYEFLLGVKCILDIIKSWLGNMFINNSVIFIDVDYVYFICFVKYCLRGNV